MVQLVANGIFLDLYQEEDIQITHSFDSFQTFSPQSSYSKTFRIPATANNNQFFLTAFDVSGFDFDITKKHPCSILVDGGLYMSGEIRLMKIFDSGDGNKIDYEVLFFDETRDLFSSIGNKLLSDLNLTGLTHDFTMENVVKSWLAPPQSAGVLALAGGNVLYPLIDFGNTYDDNEAVEQVSISQGNGQHITNPLLATNSRISVGRFKPMVSLFYLVRQIFKDAGYTINVGTYFPDIYVSAFGNSADVELQPLGNTCNVLLQDTQTFTASLNTVNFPIIILNDNNNFIESTDRYRVPSNGDYRFTVLLLSDLILPASTGGEVRFELRKNGSTILEQTTVSYDGNENIDNFAFYRLNKTYSLLTNDYLDVRIRCLSGATAYVKQGNFTCDLAPLAPVIINPLLEKDYKQIDFLKDVFTKFKFVLYPSKNKNKEFILKFYNDFIKFNSPKDWTSKLDISKDIEISPMFYEQAATIKFSDKEEKDWLNEQNNIVQKEVFGTLNLEADNDLLKGIKNITTNFAPTPVTEMGGVNSLTGGTSTQGRDAMVIPHIYNLEAGETKLLKKPIVPKTRLMFYNGLKKTGLTDLTTNDWYYNLDGVNEARDTYPMVTPYELMKPFEDAEDDQILSLDLNWQVEDTYIKNGYANPRFSVYDKYWRNYIDILYNRWSRKLTAYFILTPQDIQQWNFDHKIYIKGNWYYVNKIESVVVGKTGSYKAELIKLNNLIVPDGGYIPPVEQLFWNTTDVNWELEDVFWNG